MTTFRVCRAFPGPGSLPYAVGELVDGAGWPDDNRLALVAAGYLVPIAAAAPAPTRRRTR